MDIDDIGSRQCSLVEKNPQGTHTHCSFIHSLFPLSFKLPGAFIKEGAYVESCNTVENDICNEIFYRNLYYQVHDLSIYQIYLLLY